MLRRSSYRSTCHVSPDSLRMSGLATVTAAVKSFPLYSVSNCHVTNWDCWVWNTINSSNMKLFADNSGRFVWLVQGGGVWTRDGTDGETDIRISPGTLFWLAHAQWDAAERERSDYPKSPSHRSTPGHPKTWGRIKMQPVNSKRQQLHLFSNATQLSTLTIK